MRIKTTRARDGLLDELAPRKRIRMEKPQKINEYAPVFRDPVYYYDDADTLIIVQDTLFKIHHSLLSSDNSAFSGSISLPTGESLAGALTISEDDPLRLTDELYDFRALCYVLYTPREWLLPLDCRGMLPLVNLRFLIAVLKTANKYQFQSIEDCVTDNLVYHCCPLPGTVPMGWISPLDKLPLPELERFLNLAVVINNVQLCSAIQRHLGCAA